MKLSSSVLLSLALSASASPVPAPVAVAVSTTTLQPRLDINDVLAWITSLFPVDVSIDVATSVIAAAGQTLATVLGYSTTSNDLTNGECADVTLIFARGTAEPGNVGSLVGPEFNDALASALGGSSLAFQGVNDYDATVTEYLEGGSPTAATNMSVADSFCLPKMRDDCLLTFCSFGKLGRLS